MPDMQSLIRLKRDGKHFSTEQIQKVIESIVDGSMEDAQLGSWLMAVCLQDMNAAETATLTKSMSTSGFQFSWPNSWIVADKHSTGGVGDKVSLILAPALAVCGVKVPMISGRGLGHTGGTLDKLESIPGYQVTLSEDMIEKALDTVGCCIVGQTKTLVPADRRMYATRDVTSTVDCTPLIVSSILSKKYAETLHGLVLDVKSGSGGLQSTEKKAREMAQRLVETARGLDLPCTAVITDMNTPIGRTIGNALEVEEAISCLHDQGPTDLADLVCQLGGELLFLTGIAENSDSGTEIIQRSIKDGAAIKKFMEMIQFQGVSNKVAKQLCYDDNGSKLLPQAKFTTQLIASQSGFIGQLDALSIALACQLLGTSRKTTDDVIRYGVGVRLLKVLGDRVEEGDPWATVYHDTDIPERAMTHLKDSILIQKTPPSIQPSRILGRISTKEH